MDHVSVMLGAQLDGLGPLAQAATLAEERDVRLWLGQSFQLDSHDALTALAGRGHHVRAGLAVAVAPLRTPFDAALRARGVAALSERPFSVAYGIGTASAAAALRGAPLERPGSWVRDYAREVRALLDSDAAATGMAPYPLASPPVEVGLGVLRPRMARLAGQVADFAVTWLAPTAYLADTVLPGLEQGAAEAGRRRPRLVSVVQAAVARPGRVAPRLAAIACSTHLGLPHYQAMLRSAGVPIEGHPARDLRAAVGHGLFTYGSPADVAEVVAEHRRLGVDEVVVNVGAVAVEHGAAAAVADLAEVLDACGAEASSGRDVA
ncbi:LLM class flavin-dependent oxidoreductase [Nocardioides sp. ChNu-153]|uniref:LLM class flavin-dependent oxidoreductase n=1 Tax=Nocardioides sp. ChNu-153 TaxID=2779364 RepID=UPI00264AAF90|nr:LLM class flavin-dependent oxidoreductase [Nocardioides sp. ChNu-153]MDN7122120.1 LLM class flavin-dependent oxidoreductase [Nocardioides sp. ChNu-153]